MADIIHYKGKTVATNVNMRESLDKDMSGITKKMYCINYCNTAVTVGTRDGLKYIVANVPNRYTCQFVIRTEYFIPRSSFDCMLRLLANVQEEHEDYAELMTIKQLFLHQYDNSQTANMRLAVDTTVDQEALKQHNTVYLSSKDMVLSFLQPHDTPPHPFVQSSLLVSKYEQLIQNISGINIFLEIVDNDSDIAERFLHLSKNVFKIQPLKDDTRESGVYFGVGRTEKDGTTTTEIRRIDLDKADEELGLYRTREEALAAGDVKTTRQLEAGTLAHKNAMLTLELASTQQNLKNEAEEMKAEYNRQEFESKKVLLALQTKVTELEKENKLYLMDIERRKIDNDLMIQGLKAEYESKKLRMEDHYSGKSYDRKESLEMVKFIPSAIACGLAVWVALLKAKKS